MNNNLWFLALFFGMSFASWLYGQLREQAKLKKAREEARRQYEEGLRTGRTSTEQPRPSPQPATATAGELAERRQAQLRELRRQQDATRGGTTVVIAKPQTSPPTGVARPGSTPIVLGPGGIVIPRAPAPVRAKPAPAPARVPARPMPEVQDPRIALQQRRLREQAEHEAAVIRAEQAEEVETASQSRSALARRQGAGSIGTVESVRPRPSASRVRGLLFTDDGRVKRGAELRRLFALNEVLGRPVSMREPGAG
jgi:hypothetical protein